MPPVHVLERKKNSKKTERKISREKDTQRDRQTETKRQRQRNTKREIETERETHKEREGHRHRERERGRQRERKTARKRDRERYGERERENHWGNTLYNNYQSNPMWETGGSGGEWGGDCGRSSLPIKPNHQSKVQRGQGVRTLINQAQPPK